jgi:hypothetical protein
MQTLPKQADRTRGEEMNDLRKAAEMALKALEHFNQGNSTAVVQGEFNDEIEALRQALTPEVTPDVTPDVDNAYTKLDTSDRVLHTTNVPQP